MGQPNECAPLHIASLHPLQLGQPPTYVGSSAPLTLHRAALPVGTVMLCQFCTFSQWGSPTRMHSSVPVSLQFLWTGQPYKWIPQHFANSALHPAPCHTCRINLQVERPLLRMLWCPLVHARASSGRVGWVHAAASLQAGQRTWIEFHLLSKCRGNKR